ncbi:MAG: DNA-directed RNA polymerase subunit beta', partial [Chloroflexi bacterium]|nr:DNA-directed RNA polymerase subunit beta' [Chloroflexota bacterium]
MRARDAKTDGKLIETTVGRIIFNEVVPEGIAFRNEKMDRKAIKELVAECIDVHDNEVVAEMVDLMKDVGFEYATKSGISIAMNDLRLPEEKAGLLAEADANVAEIDDQFDQGLITKDERYDQTIAIWRKTTEDVQHVIQNRLEEYGGV